ncbi:hypothetical protein COEREDRAFT_80890 [Coemansia reversa NRRL 1564]|uniref:Uncharacterized protein n=1 Tax=Coemansia reversa (strain ATCC 12441 / NRRL 1564) TaxID=763665 RepID=A0A2G5BCU1_COERN|nr:hypothetical protein COEREDRAFT_80890 [Coemansia reversa NRRL 1564]|eukprot:PIA16821.1 hypothetical protein COEREDRAFT_80890 [Coemansia reversa NRRL 1564]
MGLYTKALFVIIGGLLGGSVGFYYQAREDERLSELRKIKLEEMRRLNQASSKQHDTSRTNVDVDQEKKARRSD